MQYYPQFVYVVGWILLAGGLVISIAPLQFIIKGRSALGEDGVLHYFLAFCGSLNIVWALIMLAAASDPVRQCRRTDSTQRVGDSRRRDGDSALGAQGTLSKRTQKQGPGRSGLDL